MCLGRDQGKTVEFILSIVCEEENFLYVSFTIVFQMIKQNGDYNVSVCVSFLRGDCIEKAHNRKNKTGIIENEVL